MRPRWKSVRSIRMAWKRGKSSRGAEKKRKENKKKKKELESWKMYLFLVLHRLLSLSMIPFVYSYFPRDWVMKWCLCLVWEIRVLRSCLEQCIVYVSLLNDTPALLLNVHFVSLVGSEPIEMTRSGSHPIRSLLKWCHNGTLGSTDWQVRSYLITLLLCVMTKDNPSSVPTTSGGLTCSIITPTFLN